MNHNLSILYPVYSSGKSLFTQQIWLELKALGVQRPKIATDSAYNILREKSNKWGITTS